MPSIGMLKQNESHFAIFTVLTNQTLVLVELGNIFNLYLWYGLFSDDFESVLLTSKILTLVVYLMVSTKLKVMTQLQML